MKNFILKSACLVLLCGVGLVTPSVAQNLNSGKNYWVVETNLKHRDFSVVRFYNAADELIYEERLNGVYLNIARPKHVKRLNLALQRVTEEPLIAAYKEVANQKVLVASLYRK